MSTEQNHEKVNELGYVVTGKGSEVETQQLLTELVIEAQREAQGGKSDTSVGLTLAAISQLHQAYSDQRVIEELERWRAFLGYHKAIAEELDDRIAQLKQGGGA